MTYSSCLREYIAIYWPTIRFVLWLGAVTLALGVLATGMILASQLLDGTLARAVLYAGAISLAVDSLILLIGSMVAAASMLQLLMRHTIPKD